MPALLRTYVDEIDEENNLPKKDKRLYNIQLMSNGKPSGSKWSFTLNKIKIYQKDVDKQDCVIFVQNEM